jgi:hypothetical protein
MNADYWITGIRPMFSQIKEENNDLKSALRILVTLHKSLVEEEQCDHEVGICWCADFNAIDVANKLLEAK